MTGNINQGDLDNISTVPASPAATLTGFRAKFWAGLVIMLVIGSGLVVFGLQAQAAREKRRDCLQLSILRFHETRPPLPPPPPPLPALLPGTSADVQEKFKKLEEQIKKAEEQHQKLIEDRNKWETSELPKIRERRVALEKKLAGVHCAALH